MEIVNYYKKVMSKYAVFKGRASRKEYWYFTLANIIIFIALSILWGMMYSSDLWEENTFSLVYSLIVLLPSLAVSVRRLHDTNRSGFWVILSFIPIFNIVLLVFLCLQSNEGVNKYGLKE